LCERLELPRALKWLSLGCGSAGQEIQAARPGLFATMEAIDLSPVSLQIAREQVQAQGVESIEFREDLNRIEPRKGRFEVVVMSMSPHHVDKLERLLDQIEQTFVPGGLQ
jgi:2-polyprenyl-3-methyl-5-hydroxy-6-metoxy-1,4-benzoquinol methylase